MGSNFVPKICGKNRINVPDSGCSDCDELERRVTLLEECCDEVKEILPTKLEIQNIIAGENITITEDGEGNIMISSEGGGGCACTKAEILECIGVREMEMSLTDMDGNLAEYYVIGRLKGEVIGDEGQIQSCECTKEQLLDILGYSEIDISMSDSEDNTQIWTILGKPKNA